MTRDVQSLFLQVDASVELLRRNLAAGEQPLTQFEQRAAKVSMSVEKSIGAMGKNFGVFSQLAQTAAQQAEQSFNDSFTQIQRMAAKAISAPQVKGGGLSLGAAEARQAADAAHQQAQALALIEKAAKSAAAGTGVMTQDTRMYLQAASAARIEAERHAAELTREAGALERLEIETRAAASGHQLLAQSQRGVVTSSGQQRQSTMMLGQQVQDFAVQVVSGQSVLIAFSQQIGQAAFAVQGMGGKMGTVAAFLGSGWGAAVLVATTVLVPLVGKMLEQNDALEDAVDKLKKEAAETQLNDRAHAAFSRTIEGQIDAVRRLNDELDRSIRTQKQEQQLTLLRANANVQKLQQSQPKQEKEIGEQEALVRQYQDQMKNPAKYGLDENALAGLALVASQAESKLQALRKQLDDTKRSITDGQRAMREAQIPLIQTDVEAGLDRKAAATQRYTDAMGRLNRQFAIGAGNKGREFLDEKTGNQYGRMLNGIDAGTYQRESAKAGRIRDQAYKAEEDRLAAESRSRSSARSGSLTPAQVGSLLKDQFGGTITSTTGGKHAPNSYHYRSQAVDFVPRGGMGAVTKAQMRSYLESQGVDIKELLGPGDKNHSDHFHVAFSKSQRSQSQIAARVETAQNAILADQISYAEQERQARRRLLDAQGRSATTEEERDRLAREEIEADYSARKTKIEAQLARKDLKPTEAATLNKANEDTKDQQLRNIQIERAKAGIVAGFEDSAQSRQQQMAILRIREDMAFTATERRDIQRQLLELEQQERRAALERIRQTSDDPREVMRATSALQSLPELEAHENDNLTKRQAGPLDQYRQRLTTMTSDMNTAMEQIEVRGLENVEDGLVGIITGTQSVGGAFKRMANDIIADLARIAIKKLILNQIGGGGGILSVFGLSSGGKVEGRAQGGKISGPGTGTSDSILAMLGSKPIMLSNGESIVTAAATAKFWPVIDAMNKGKLKGLARGGLVSTLPSMPAAPRLPSMMSSRSQAASLAPVQHFHVNAQGAVLAGEVFSEMRSIGVQSLVGGSQMAQQEWSERQAQVLV